MLKTLYNTAPLILLFSAALKGNITVVNSQQKTS